MGLVRAMESDRLCIADVWCTHPRYTKWRVKMEACLIHWWGVREIALWGVRVSALWESGSELSGVSGSHFSGCTVSPGKELPRSEAA